MGDLLATRPARRSILSIVGGFLLLSTVLIGAQNIDMDAAQAREEFRLGVQAYYSARFGEAIVSFNRALAYQSDFHLARFWLGRAYYRAGFEEAALSEWELVIEARAAGAFLLSQVETLRYRRGLIGVDWSAGPWVRSSRFAGQTGDTRLFMRPNGMAALRDGSVLVAATGSGTVVRIGPNGRIQSRLLGGVEGLNRPFDVVVTAADEVLVSEFGSDRLTLMGSSGNRLISVGGTGIEPGRLLGPQYVALDQDGFWYVTEWANRRVSKFAPDGAFVAVFGGANAFFEGLRRPTGIVAIGEFVYVADRVGARPVLRVFDIAGNFVETIDLPWRLADEQASVESLRVFDGSIIMVAFGDAVHLFDLERRAVVTTIQDGDLQRATAAVRDANNRLLVADFNAGHVGIFEPEGTLYSGLTVFVERVIATQFPLVSVLVLVTDRDGRPIVGLDQSNFVLSEAAIPQTSMRLEASGYAMQEFDMAVVVDLAAPSGGGVARVVDGVFVTPRAAGGTGLLEEAARSVATLSELVPPDRFYGVYVTGEQPRRIISRPASPERFAAEVREAVSAGGEAGLQLDRTVRLAAGELLNRSLRRRLMIVSDGSVHSESFPGGIEELTSYLRNNGVTVDLMLVERRAPAAELRYVVEETGGSVYITSDPAGLTGYVESVQRRPSGRYWLSYQSPANTDFGRAYIPFSVEARLLVRSGRDEVGFFAPLQF